MNWLIRLLGGVPKKHYLTICAAHDQALKDNRDLIMRFHELHNKLEVQKIQPPKKKKGRPKKK